MSHVGDLLSPVSSSVWPATSAATALADGAGVGVDMGGAWVDVEVEHAQVGEELRVGRGAVVEVEFIHVEG